jgi:hypothetical protein
MQAVKGLEFASTRDPANAAYYNGVKGWALEVAGRPEESLAALNAGMLFAGLPSVRLWSITDISCVALFQ